ncbi:alpha/beta hydrolase [Streptomyces spiroverticillatus]|uniref:Alpha/beta hydrolase n=1 Tax=Streptomyces finlayi TaxID=67296 RepID=A0A918X670_9ACTN|nr:alpha/beta hydrolase [Streptomyces finlayi]GHA39189.1 alpha/beta hydrolase [Streptomyces spiroverticillatus]GHD14109.1 alpha/beta hydrolase [Streptomyces finlayi]
MSEHDAANGIHVVHDGPPQGPPLLLLHGSGASGASWGPMLPALAAHHHVVRVDLPGSGQSPPPPTYDVPAQADRVAEVLDGLGLRSVTVAGHSSGGYVATALAERRPDLAAALVLISTGPRAEALLPQPAIVRALTAPPFGPLVWAVRSEPMVRKGLAATMARPVPVPDAVVADLKHTTYRGFRRVLHGYDAYLAERAVPDRLAALDVPVRVVFGGADPRWDPASARLYATVARVEMLAGVGHVPLWEAPEETARLLLEFVERGAGAPSERRQQA